MYHLHWYEGQKAVSEAYTVYIHICNDTMNEYKANPLACKNHEHSDPKYLSIASGLANIILYTMPILVCSNAFNYVTVL